jgi:zinc transporter, ZIP family
MDERVRGRVTSATAPTARDNRMPLWLAGLVPLALITALVAGFLILNPIAGLREVPPVEAIAIERTVFGEDGIELHVRNDGPDPVRIAQVLVNDAYRDFVVSDPELGRLESATIELDYPWDPGLPLTFGLVTSTGVVIEHEVEAAALTPAPDAETLWIYALLGLYIGLIPVSIGLLWWPALRRVDAGWLAFFLAFTVGLLAFLLVDTTVEGVELASEAPAVLNGLGLFSLGALGAVVGLVVLERALGSRREDRSSQARPLGGLLLAYLVAAGIGLHNLGEGLAVGAALAAGEAALGTFLVVGFAVHNTTEGLAIVAPLGSSHQRPALWHFVALGALAGLPAVLGAWAGGFAFSPATAALAFGVAAGAIAQVIWQIARGMARSRGLSSGFGAAGLMVGFLLMYVTGLLT